MEGWVKVYRKLLDNEVFYGSQLTLGVFITLLLRADQNGVVKVGRLELAKRFRAKPSTIYQTLQRLSKVNILSMESNNQFTTISILNWGVYQNKVTTKQQPSNNQVTLYKEYKNKNKEKERDKEKENFDLTPIQLKELQDKFTNVNVHNEYEKAKDWILATGNTKKDYLAFFRGWCRRTQEAKSPVVNETPQRPVNPELLAAAQRIREKLAQEKVMS